jgi:hypothetical protein
MEAPPNQSSRPLSAVPRSISSGEENSADNSPTTSQSQLSLGSSRQRFALPLTDDEEADESILADENSKNKSGGKLENLPVFCTKSRGANISFLFFRILVYLEATICRGNFFYRTIETL